MQVAIYIPIWLDLLFSINRCVLFRTKNLHSNMVRFIIRFFYSSNDRIDNLHSNMVRFIMTTANNNPATNYKFTFQYGQIYYSLRRSGQRYDDEIYIPIWLDLLYESDERRARRLYDLHSNMVRFIIQPNELTETGIRIFTFQYGQIYYFRS